ncbi:uncharacterized protein [Diadema antillarum]|uniref:uncharacterized protein n=1 Tax=Diadema antillarum TaxID=105358 RepID=UPI003A837EAE
MATQKKNTVYILLSIALIWNYGGMSSNVESDCEFDSPMTYDESSDCPNGAKGLMLCEPGQVKIKPCISADEDTTDICSDCGTNERVQTHCTTTSDTVCISIFTEPSTTLQESTTELYAGSTTAADKNPEPVQKSSSLDRLHVALIAVICVLLILMIPMALVVVYFIWKSGVGSRLCHVIQRNNENPENAGASSGGGGNDRRSATASAIELTSRPGSSTQEESKNLMAGTQQTSEASL